MGKERYHTPREVARILRVSPTTVMKLIHEGQLYAVRVSERVYRIPVGALHQFEESTARGRANVHVREVEDIEPLGEPVDDLATSSRR